MKPETKKVLADLKEEFTIIENIPSEIGYYNSRPIFIKNKTLVNGKNIHVQEKEIDGINYLVRQYSPSFRQKDKDGYYYIVYYNVISYPSPL